MSDRWRGLVILAAWIRGRCPSFLWLLVLGGWRLAGWCFVRGSVTATRRSSCRCSYVYGWRTDVLAREDHKIGVLWSPRRAFYRTLWWPTGVEVDLLERHLIRAVRELGPMRRLTLQHRRRLARHQTTCRRKHQSWTTGTAASAWKWTQYRLR